MRSKGNGQKSKGKGQRAKGALWVRGARSMVLLGLLLVGAGCRQSDGEFPVPVGEQPNKIEDVGRDLQNVAGRQADAEQELFADLSGFGGVQPPVARVQQLSTAVADAVRDQSLDAARANEIARLLFVTVTAEELSPRQIDKLGQDLHTALVDAGTAAAPAERASAAARDLQSVITLNPRRWYHVF